MTAKKNSTGAANSKVKVLYQNLNGVWYAFAKVGGDVFFGRVPLQASTKTLSPAEQEVVKQFPNGKKAASKAA